MEYTTTDLGKLLCDLIEMKATVELADDGANIRVNGYERDLPALIDRIRPFKAELIDVLQGHPIDGIAALWELAHYADA